jgi:hypothetical protein
MKDRLPTKDNLIIGDVGNCSGKDVGVAGGDVCVDRVVGGVASEVRWEFAGT